MECGSAPHEAESNLTVTVSKISSRLYRGLMAPEDLQKLGFAADESEYERIAGSSKSKEGEKEGPCGSCYFVENNVSR